MRKALMAMAAVAALAACQKKPAEVPRPPAPPGAAPASRAAQPSALPQRAPGLWEQKVTTAGRSQVTRLCLDKAVEARFTWWGQHAGQGGCSPAQITPRGGGGWSFASTCRMGEGGVTSTRGEVTGDFARAYKVSASSTISGAAAPEMNGTHDMTLEAAWKGPCPPGVRPGDMLLPGGMTINVMQIPSR